MSNLNVTLGLLYFSKTDAFGALCIQARFTTAVAQGGGTCHENVTQFTSVLVCGSVQSSKFAVCTLVFSAQTLSPLHAFVVLTVFTSCPLQKCKEHNIPVVTLSWLEETVKTGVRQPFTAHAMQAFTGVTLTTTGIFETEGPLTLRGNCLV